MTCYLVASLACAQVLLHVPSLHPAWPGTGFGVGLVLVGGPLMPVVVFAGALVTALVAGFPLLDAAVNATTTVAVALLCGLALRWLLPRTLRLDTSHGVTSLLLVSALGGMLAASMRHLAFATIPGLVDQPMYAGAAPGVVWLTISIATAVGIMIVAPGVLAWCMPPGDRLPWPPLRVVELVVHLAAVVAIGALLLETDRPDNRLQVLGAMLTYPLVAWAAVSFGSRGASALSIVLALLVTLTPSANLGILASDTFSLDLLRVQFYLVSVTLTGLILSAAFERRRHAERALATSEARTRALIDHAPEGILIARLEPYEIVSANRRAERIFGWAESEMVGRSPAMLSAQVQPDGNDRAVGVSRVIASALAGDEPQLEWLYRRRDGSTFPAEVRVVALPGADGPLVRVSIADISIRKSAERVDFAQRQVLEAIATGAPHLDILAQIVGVSEQIVHGSMGSILLVNESGTSLRQAAAPNMPPSLAAAVDGLPIGPLNGACGSAAYSGEQAVIDDVEHDPRLEGWRELARAHAIKAVWSTPFASEGGAVLGTLALYLRDARAPQPAESQALRAMANLAGIAAQAERAELRLREAQQHLQQAQKMEAVGQLAGGIAHDFNNILTVILATSQLLLDDVEEAPQTVEDLRLIRDSAERAGILTRQLLAFSRRQMWQPRVVDVNAVIIRLRPMCERVLGAPSKLELSLSHDVGSTWIDEGQLEQVIVNLIVNARDAMPTGGVVSIASSMVDIATTAMSARANVARGRYVEVAVTDTGTGIEEEVLRRIFEPFFTTKPLGQGTGLGLATAYGIIQRAEGTITVESVPGAGTKFTVLLPWREAAPAEPLPREN